MGKRVTKREKDRRGLKRHITFTRMYIYLIGVKKLLKSNAMVAVSSNPTSGSVGGIFEMVNFYWLQYILKNTEFSEGFYHFSNYNKIRIKNSSIFLFHQFFYFINNTVRMITNFEHTETTHCSHMYYELDTCRIFHYKWSQLTSRWTILAGSMCIGWSTCNLRLNLHIFFWFFFLRFQLNFSQPDKILMVPEPNWHFMVHIHIRCWLKVTENLTGRTPLKNKI